MMSSKETKNQTRLYLSALLMLAATAVLSTVTTSGNNVFAQSDSEEDSNGNSDNVADNGNSNNDEETETGTGTGTETEEESTTTEQASDDNDDDNPNGNDDNVPGDNPQPDRVGSHDDQTSDNGANSGGTVTDETIPCEIRDDQTGCVGEASDGTVTTNCFGKVISHEAREHKEEGSDEGTLGEHSRDPVPEIPGNETPRQGIGNQDQGHPAAHGAFNSQFEEEDADNVEENC